MKIDLLIWILCFNHWISTFNHYKLWFSHWHMMFNGWVLSLNDWMSCMLHHALCIMHRAASFTNPDCLQLFAGVGHSSVTIRNHSPLFYGYPHLFFGCIMMHRGQSWCITIHDPLRRIEWCIIIHHDASWCWLGESRRCAKQYIYIYIYIWCIIHVYIYPGSLGLGALALLVPSHSDLRCPKITARNVSHKIRAGASRSAESSPEAGPVSWNAFRNRSPKWTFRHQADKQSDR